MKPVTVARRLLALSASDRFDLFTAMVLLPVSWLGLRWLGLARWRNLLLRTSATAPRPSRHDPGQVGQLVNAAARHSIFPSTCLTRSLLLEWMLRRRGLAATLRVGVQGHDAGIKAHAWVECDGIPLNEKPDIASEFAPFPDFAPASSALPFR